ncbi:MAG: SCO family protein [Pseudomonadota bacterium]
MVARIFGLAALFLAGCSPQEPAPVAGGAAAGCMTRAYSTIGGPIDLVDQTGAPVTEADLMGSSSLVFFGFTYCPDVCPMTLYTLGQAMELLPEGVDAPRTVLISVDPERDTPEALGAYLSNDAFPENTLGLTGSGQALRAAAQAFKADFQRVEQPGSAMDYTMNHTSLVYLMDSDWALQTFFTHADDAESIAQCLAAHLGEGA